MIALYGRFKFDAFYRAIAKVVSEWMVYAQAWQSIPRLVEF